MKNKTKSKPFYTHFEKSTSFPKQVKKQTNKKPSTTFFSLSNNSNYRIEL